MTWHEAEIHCKKEGGHLASIHSEEENDFVSEYATNSTSAAAWFWIGANDLMDKGQIVWSDHSVFNYSTWQIGEPNKGAWEIEDCVQISYTKFKGHWKDTKCLSTSYFVCKIDHPSISSPEQEPEQEAEQKPEPELVPEQDKEPELEEKPGRKFRCREICLPLTY